MGRGVRLIGATQIIVLQNPRYEILLVGDRHNVGFVEFHAAKKLFSDMQDRRVKIKDVVRTRLKNFNYKRDKRVLIQDLIFCLGKHSKKKLQVFVESHQTHPDGPSFEPCFSDLVSVSQQRSRKELPQISVFENTDYRRRDNAYIANTDLDSLKRVKSFFLESLGYRKEGKVALSFKEHFGPLPAKKMKEAFLTSSLANRSAVEMWSVIRTCLSDTLLYVETLVMDLTTIFRMFRGQGANTIVCNGHAHIKHLARLIPQFFPDYQVVFNSRDDEEEMCVELPFRPFIKLLSN
jgi:hypothetical protein